MGQKSSKEEQLKLKMIDKLEKESTKDTEFIKEAKKDEEKDSEFSFQFSDDYNGLHSETADSNNLSECSNSSESSNSEEDQEVKLPTSFVWNEGGNEVFITGSFSNWEENFKMKVKNYDFGGWATRNDLKCSDGRTIRTDAFKHLDGKTVPLIWGHDHSGPENVLGHAVLENRKDGVYAYCSFNDSNASAFFLTKNSLDQSLFRPFSISLRSSPSKISECSFISRSAYLCILS